MVRLVHVTTAPESLWFLRGQVAYLKARGVDVWALSSPGELLDQFAAHAGVPVHDLKLQDFQILEDGNPQTVSTIEYVNVRTGTPQEQRRIAAGLAKHREHTGNPQGNRAETNSSVRLESGSALLNGLMP